MNFFIEDEDASREAEEKRLKHNARARAYYKKNKDKEKARLTKYKRTHKKEIKETKHKYYINNKEKTIVKATAYTKEHKKETNMGIVKTVTVSLNGETESMRGMYTVFDAVTKGMLQEIKDTRGSVFIKLDIKKFAKSARYIINTITEGNIGAAKPSYYTAMFKKVMEQPGSENFRRDRKLICTFLAHDFLYVDNINVLFKGISAATSGSSLTKRNNIIRMCKPLLEEVTPMHYTDLEEMPKDQEAVFAFAPPIIEPVRKAACAEKLVRKAACAEKAKRTEVDCLAEIFPEEELRSLINAVAGEDFNKFARTAILKLITYKATRE